MNIWLDDIRLPPDGWTWVKDPDLCIEMLDKCRNQVVSISLDHDLGLERTGYDVIKWIEEQVYLDLSYHPPYIKIHSANSVGIDNMEAALTSIKKQIRMRMHNEY